MARQDKATVVADISQRLDSSSATVLTEYRGLTVGQLKELRRALGAETQYTIVKNTLTKRAAEQAGIEGLDEYLTGPSALAFVDGDIVAAAKGLKAFAKDHPALVIKAGYMEGRVIPAGDVLKLADLESREVLLAKLAGAMQASAQQAVSLLAAPLSQAARAVGALQAKVEQDGPAQAVAAPEPTDAPDATAAVEDTAVAATDADDDVAPAEETE